MHYNRQDPQLPNDTSWNYESDDFIFYEKINQVTEKINGLSYDEVSSMLEQKIVDCKLTGLKYLKLSSDSRVHSAVVHFNPFGNSLNGSMLIRAFYIQKVLEEFDFKDGNGFLPDMISFTAVNARQRFKPNRTQLKAIANGDFAKIAEVYVKSLQSQGYTQLFIIGFSQGATLAAAVAHRAVLSGIEVSHAVFGEPANVQNRRKRKLSRSFIRDYKHLKKAVDDSRIVHLTPYSSPSKLKIFTSILYRPRLNYSLVAGLSHGSFERDFEYLANSKTVVTIGWSGLGSVCPPETIKQIIAKTRQLPTSNSIYTVSVSNTSHVWADRVNLLATFYIYGLTRQAD